MENNEETVEEAAKNYGWGIKINTFSDAVKANELAESAQQDFIAGAKWQAERMYSEEEVKEIIKLSCEEGMLIQRTINDKVKIPYWRIKDFTIRMFEQFKNK